MDLLSFAMGLRNGGGSGGGSSSGFTDADKLTLDEASEASQKSLELIGDLLSGLQCNVYKRFISASGFVNIRAIRGVVDEIKVSSSYAGQTMFVARVRPVYSYKDGETLTVHDPDPQIQSATVASDGSVAARIDLFNDNYIIVVTTTDLTAALVDRDVSVTFAPVLFSCRYLRRTNELFDCAEFPAVSETDYANALGHQLTYEEITDSPDDIFLNTDRAVFLFDGTDYYEAQTKPSSISTTATFYVAKYQRLTD